MARPVVVPELRAKPVRAATWALGWAVLFTVAHAYWYLGGKLGLGDAPDPLPGMPHTALGWTFNAIVALMFIAGLALPLSMLRSHGPKVPRRLLLFLLWVGCVVLVLRGGSGLLDDLVRDLGISDGGITGLDYQTTLGQAHPSTYTLWSTAIVDAYFLLGGALFCVLARAAQHSQISSSATELPRPDTRSAAS
jgi:Protein of unknown function (DUF3995)